MGDDPRGGDGDGIGVCWIGGGIGGFLLGGLGSDDARDVKDVIALRRCRGRSRFPGKSVPHNSRAEQRMMWVFVGAAEDVGSVGAVEDMGFVGRRIEDLEKRLERVAKNGGHDGIGSGSWGNGGRRGRKRERKRSGDDEGQIDINSFLNPKQISGQNETKNEMRH